MSKKVINPISGRKITVGGTLHKRLCKNVKIKIAGCPKDTKPKPKTIKIKIAKTKPKTVKIKIKKTKEKTMKELMEINYQKSKNRTVPKLNKSKGRNLIEILINLIKKFMELNPNIDKPRRVSYKGNPGYKAVPHGFYWLRKSIKEWKSKIKALHDPGTFYHNVFFTYLNLVEGKSYWLTSSNQLDEFDEKCIERGKEWPYDDTISQDCINIPEYKGVKMDRRGLVELGFWSPRTIKIKKVSGKKPGNQNIKIKIKKEEKMAPFEIKKLQESEKLKIEKESFEKVVKKEKEKILKILKESIKGNTYNLLRPLTGYWLGDAGEDIWNYFVDIEDAMGKFTGITYGTATMTVTDMKKNEYGEWLKKNNITHGKYLSFLRKWKKKIEKLNVEMDKIASKPNAQRFDSNIDILLEQIKKLDQNMWDVAEMNIEAFDYSINLLGKGKKKKKEKKEEDDKYDFIPVEDFDSSIEEIEEKKEKKEIVKEDDRGYFEPLSGFRLKMIDNTIKKLTVFEDDMWGNELEFMDQLDHTGNKKERERFMNSIENNKNKVKKKLEEVMKRHVNDLEYIGMYKIVDVLVELVERIREKFKVG